MVGSAKGFKVEKFKGKKKLLYNGGTALKKKKVIRNRDGEGKGALTTPVRKKKNKQGSKRITE